MDKDYAYDYIEERLNEGMSLGDLRQQASIARDALYDADSNFSEVAIFLNSGEMATVPVDCTVDEVTAMEFGQQIGYAIEMLDEFEYYLEAYDDMVSE